MKKRLLVVEDHVEFAELMAFYLRDNGYAVDVLFDGLRAIDRTHRHRYDLVILDVGLPGKDGLELCHVFREACPDQMIMLVTGKASEKDTVEGFEHGADAYLSKPFTFMELNARIRALLRRSDRLLEPDPLDSELLRGPLVLDLQQRTALLDSKSLELTTKEFDLIAFLAKSPGRVFSREKLLEEVWGYAYGGYTHTVNSHVNRLRRKLEACNPNYQFIVTLRGAGYKFNEEFSGD